MRVTPSDCIYTLNTLRR